MASSSDSLQASIVLKETKRILDDGIQVSKEARESIQLSATIFIHYITAAALDIAQSQKKSTIQPSHILKALEENGFEMMIPEIEDFVQQIEINAAKSTKQGDE
ncbi:hypothetical protein WA171_006131 [Blastocystis sp. BT1]